MTTEQRFKKLLEIACDNGYDKETFELLENEQFKIINHFIFIGGDNYQRNSLNDLVFNTNFFECLFKDVEIYSFYRYIVNNPFHLDLALELNKIDTFKIQWFFEAKKGNALEWLFKQFEI